MLYTQILALAICNDHMTELIASVWTNRLALSLYGQLNEMILEKPTHVTYCDNAAVVQLAQVHNNLLLRVRHRLDTCPRVLPASPSCSF